jgi:nitrite reductase (NADH) small subunit
MYAQAKASTSWNDVCHVNELVTNSGVCVLVDGIQIALFDVLVEGKHQYFAISNWDPIGQANVLYRGIVGSLQGNIVVASPLYKEHYVLATGACIEREDVSVHHYAVRVEQERVLVAL